jgi:BlaI family penicillinase repressor
MAELTDCELVIMQALWRNGAMTAQGVERALSYRFANSTVRTFLRILERKGHVAHRKKGRSFIYEALTTRQRATREAFQSVVDRFFDGSIDSLRAWLDGVEGEAPSEPVPFSPGRRLNERPGRTSAPPRRRRRTKPSTPAAARSEEPRKSPTEQDVWLL